MMAEHGQPCDAKEAGYCMNEATCYKISSMNLLSCVCRENYKGSRCEQYLLPVQTEQDRGLLAAVIFVAILILVVLAVIILYVYRMLKSKNQRKNQVKSSNMSYKI
ncbi:pro-neuregulin-4, membrane-bound isoform [Austrofundulus limnaeus]|uniref:Pro-neuregulin-4, membrane-bound isoform n=1 Tax=Austrofundulus limnaeus TaxID=52670 RepID=A0A2I4AU77_AUSLI|nr:PREDICTED: pro-neuregulin-4, membrane-bound isoform [Austrofundulus limnaeus]